MRMGTLLTTTYTKTLPPCGVVVSRISNARPGGSAFLQVAVYYQLNVVPLNPPSLCTTPQVVRIRAGLVAVWTTNLL